MCGRAPGAICKYSFKIGALFSTFTSFKSTCSLIPCTSLAFPPAALTFLIQFVSLPNMDTKYLSPFIIAIASGKLITFPEFLPTTSKVTNRSGNIPSEWSIAQPLFNILASVCGCPLRYIHLFKSAGMFDIFMSFLVRINRFPWIAQKVAEDLIGHALRWKNITIRFDIQPGFSGSIGDVIFHGFQRNRMIG